MPKHSGIVDHNAEWGITKLFHRHHDGDWTYQMVQDIEPIIEANKDEQNSGISQDGPLGRRVARIPLVLIAEIQKTYGIDFYNRDHWPALKRLLNSSEFSHLRTDNTVL